MKFLNGPAAIAGAALLASASAAGVALDVSNPASIRSAASTVAHKLFEFYSGNKSGEIPGLLDNKYYWWEAGAMFGSAIDYWYYTGDATYNDITRDALLFQVGPNNDYMPPNQTKSLGNDDQCFWGIAAMQAAEANFPNPPADKPQWLALAQAVFNSQALRWDNATCGGGLRWQVFPFNNGYSYKNSISNGCFFNLASRLAAYTGNHTYQDWATRTYEWTVDVGLISSTYSVFDGTSVDKNCTVIDHIQWSYDAGIFLFGASVMWNITQDEVWKQRANGLWNSSRVFFAGTDNSIMYEVACETPHNCSVDELAFKAYFARWIAAASKVAPFLKSSIKQYLVTSAKAAAAQCNGGKDGITCGTSWINSTWDGTEGVGQQLSALEVIQSLLIDTTNGSLTNATTTTSANASTSSGAATSSSAAAKSAASSKGMDARTISTMLLIGLFGAVWCM